MQTEDRTAGSSRTTRVLILGGGFGGIYAALHLDKAIATEPKVEVTLVNRALPTVSKNVSNGVRTVLVRVGMVLA